MIKELFKGVVVGIKKMAQVKAALDAFDDDTDLDGVAEYEELKGCFSRGHKIVIDKCVPAAKELIAELKQASGLAVGLINHIAKAIKEA